MCKNYTPCNGRSGEACGPTHGAADELISLVTRAKKTGLTADNLANTILPNPTFSEGIRWAATKA